MNDTADIDAREDRTTIGPLLGIVLGLAHGAGANLPQYAWLQAIALSGALFICFRAERAERRRINVLSALSFSLASATLAHGWLGSTLVADDALGLALGCCVFAALMIGIAFLPAAAIAIASVLVKKSSSRRFAPLVLALLYPLAEIATGELVGFEWHATGYAWIETPLAQLLPTIGIYGVGALVVLLCEWLVLALDTLCIAPSETRNVARAHALTASAVIVVLLFARWPVRIAPATAADSGVRTRLVQTDLPTRLKFDSLAATAHVEELVALARGGHADLIVAPETTIPFAWLQLPEVLRAHVRSVATRPDQLFLVGMFDFREDGAQLNVTHGLSGSPGSQTPPRYAKHRLVPVAEYSPPGLAWIADLLALPYADRVTDDSPDPAFAVAGTRVKNTLCLDLVYPGELAATAPITGIIVNQSSFAAFAGERVRDQFMTIARARALEQAKPVVIASNSGPTAAIAADGKVIARLPSHGAAALDVVIHPGNGTTLYATLGETGWILLLVAGSVLLAVISRARRRPD